MNKITLFFIIFFMVCITFLYINTSNGKLFDGKINSESVKTLTIYKTVYNISNIFKWTRFEGYIVRSDKNKKIVRYNYINGRLNSMRRFDDVESEMNSCVPMLLEDL